MLYAKENKPFHHLGIFFLLFLGVFVTQYLGVLFMGSSMEQWYQGLEKPFWGPRKEIFGSVWIFLYINVAAIGYLLWRGRKGKSRKKALILWWIQLICNGLWAYFFFHLRFLSLGIFGLGALIGVTLWLFFYARKVSRGATILLFPYLIWLVYAFSLSSSLWWKN